MKIETKHKEKDKGLIMKETDYKKAQLKHRSGHYYFWRIDRSVWLLSIGTVVIREGNEKDIKDYYNKLINNEHH
ncbi:MAG: hypothetical protein OEM46_00690 [Ignavibacteria bacterium]|nr:hypothetical protein [Ignavibacteria bacterium]